MAGFCATLEATVGMINLWLRCIAPEVGRAYGVTRTTVNCSTLFARGVERLHPSVQWHAAVLPGEVSRWDRLVLNHTDVTDRMSPTAVLVDQRVARVVDLAGNLPGRAVLVCQGWRTPGMTAGHTWSMWLIDGTLWVCEAHNHPDNDGVHDPDPCRVPGVQIRPTDLQRLKARYSDGISCVRLMPPV